MCVGGLVTLKEGNIEETLPSHLGPFPPSQGEVRSFLYHSEGCGGMCGCLPHLRT